MLQRLYDILMMTSDLFIQVSECVYLMDRLIRRFLWAEGQISIKRVLYNIIKTVLVRVVLILIYPVLVSH